MKSTSVAIAALLACVSMQALAQAQNLPAPVRAEMESNARSCRESGGRFSSGPNYILTADFNGDGQPDYIIDSNQEKCEGTMLQNCGSGGCAIEAFVSSPSGYRNAELNGLGGPPKIDRAAKPPVLVIPTRGGAQRLRWGGKAFVDVRERR